MSKEIRYKGECPKCKKPSTYIFSGETESYNPKFKVKCLTCECPIISVDAIEITKDSKGVHINEVVRSAINV